MKYSEYLSFAQKVSAVETLSLQNCKEDIFLNSIDVLHTFLFVFAR